MKKLGKIKNLLEPEGHQPRLGVLDLLKYIGPGFIVTVGFIDPGNWASNLEAGAKFGYHLLWMVTLSTVMLIILQHNAAHLGIATGLCLSEATTKYVRKPFSIAILTTAMMASVSTSLAEILGSAIALQMLFKIPIPIGVVITTIFVLILLLTNTYYKVEKLIIAFVSLIGLSFVFELSLVKIDWKSAAIGWTTPSFPEGSILIIMSVLGAVVMPHNLFLHSEVIQSRKWNLESDSIIQRQLKYEFLDTILSMVVGWAINSAMILLAAATFHANNVPVSELQQAKELLTPLLGSWASLIFAIALLFSGISSTITSAMAAGSIFAGIFNEPFDIKDNHSRIGVFISLGIASGIIFLIQDPLKGLIISQAILSMQLPITIFLQIYLTSSEKVMGKYKNPPSTNVVLFIVAGVVTTLNLLLIYNLLFG